MLRERESAGSTRDFVIFRLDLQNGHEADRFVVITDGQGIVFKFRNIISICVSPNTIRTLELAQQHFSHDDFPPLMRVDYPHESNVRALP